MILCICDIADALFLHVCVCGVFVCLCLYVRVCVCVCVCGVRLPCALYARSQREKNKSSVVVH